MLLNKLHWVSFELLLADQAAKVIGFTIVSDFELSCLFVKNHAANGVFRHYLVLTSCKSVHSAYYGYGKERGP